MLCTHTFRPRGVHCATTVHPHQLLKPFTASNEMIQTFSILQKSISRYLMLVRLACVTIIPCPVGVLAAWLSENMVMSLADICLFFKTAHNSLCSLHFILEDTAMIDLPHGFLISNDNENICTPIITSFS